MSARFRIGIDLGGTKIEGAAIDACGSVRFRHRVATPAQDYRETINAIIDLVSTIEQEIGATPPVGIGIPGAVSPATGLIKNANSTWLIGHPLQRDLERALGRPTRLANDANCFALSEATDGAGAAAETVFGVILGTGVGGGIAIRRQILVGANAIAGEWGTIRCLGQRRTRFPDQPAGAADPVVSKPSFRARRWLRIITATIMRR